MNLTEKVAVALLKHRYGRNMGRVPALTDEEILETVSMEQESYEAVMADARAVIAVVQAEPAHSNETCHVCRKSAGLADGIPPGEIPNL